MADMNTAIAMHGTKIAMRCNISSWLSFGVVVEFTVVEVVSLGSAEKVLWSTRKTNFPIIIR